MGVRVKSNTGPNCTQHKQHRANAVCPERERVRESKDGDRKAGLEIGGESRYMLVGIKRHGSRNQDTWG